MQDNEIIIMLEARDEAALEQLGLSYGRLLHSIADSILRSSEDAEECVNDAMLKVWNTVPPAKPASLRSYAAMVTRGIAINRYNSRHAEKREHAATPLDELADFLTTGETPEDSIEAQALADAVNAFLAKLDASSRILFMRRYWYCDSTADLASKLGISENNLNVRLHRIRKKLKQHLERSHLL